MTSPLHGDDPQLIEKHFLDRQQKSIPTKNFINQKVITMTSDNIALL